jgi:predicted RNA binding protein YcfA (HicA-like mRNA interferase family)
MTRLPRVSGKQVVQALERNGFARSHVRGSHYYLRNSEGGGLIVIPVHGNRYLPAGTLRAILRQADLDVDTFIGILHD